MGPVLLFAAFAAGFAGLFLSAEWLVTGAIRLARRFSVSPLTIGLTVVAVGTSAPEMAVSVLASLSGNPGIALGNVVGSNIANIGLILGLSALLKTIRPHERIVRIELPLLLLITVSITVAAWLDALSPGPGAVLVLAFAGYSYAIYRYGKAEEVVVEEDGPAGPVPPLPASSALTLAGLAGLLLSSKALIWGASGIADLLGVPQLIIGLTVTALGTSLPELATSLAAAKKGEADIVLGNVIGSNIANSTAVLGMSSLFAHISVSQAAFQRDFLSMLGMTLLLFLAAARGRPIGRTKAGLFLLGYIIYICGLMG